MNGLGRVIFIQQFIFVEEDFFKLKKEKKEQKRRKKRRMRRLEKQLDVCENKIIKNNKEENG